MSDLPPDFSKAGKALQATATPAEDRPRDGDGDDDCNKITSSNSSSSSNSQKSLPLRDRAISAPANGVTLSPMDQKLAVNPVIAETKHEFEREPTAQDWTAGIDCISKLLGAMLADNDRGVARS